MDYNMTFPLGGMSHGMPMGYGGNFIDVLMRDITEKGWDGISFAPILTFYLYLSLGKIREMFTYLNEKIAEKVRHWIENYGNNIQNTGLEYFEFVFGRIPGYLSNVKNLFKKEKARLEIEKKEEPEPNRFRISLSTGNKADLMAIGNLILKNKHYFNRSLREHTDKYKTLEEYVLPETLILKELDDYKILLSQSIEMKIACEFDEKTETLKDVRIKIPKKLENTIDAGEFDRIARNAINLNFSTSDLPKFEYHCYYCDPYAMTNGYYKYLYFILYYTKNFDVLKKLFVFFQGDSHFCFNGKKYKLSEPMTTVLPNLRKNNYAETIDNFILEADKYSDNLKERIKEWDYTEAVEKFISDNKNMFDEVSEINPYLDIIFESKTIDCKTIDCKTIDSSDGKTIDSSDGNILSTSELLEISREFMREQISEYYQQNSAQIGNKVSIYKINIGYDITIQKKDNPEYKEWFDKYGKKEKDEKDEKDENGDNEKSEQDSESDSDKPEKKKKKKKKKKNGNDNDDDDDDLFDMYPQYPKYYPAMKYYCPQKFIEEEVKTARVDCVHIKSDKKPFQYLYLDKDVKKSLESYLKNFKCDRNKYEEMGIPYKGGIILSGKPGCGKSSTILAIATYLGKDIYYLDLGQIKTNTELRLCINHLQTNSQNGGVIIFEDIDCMTDIVMKRSDSVTSENDTLTKITNNSDDSLSLSFLLNILDGTMSPEDVIFIMTTNHIDKLDPALIRPGRMDLNIELKKCDKYQLSRIYLDLYGHELSSEILERFQEFEFTTADVILNLFHNRHNENISERELLKKFITF
jgi:SpoVK/Ycf46/Vps4 family AAA+-type ATPase